MDEECVSELPRGGDLPWALFYPADYSVASSSLGYQYIYSALKELGVAAERFCSGPVPFRSIEGDTLLERFPVITASVAYEGNAEVFFKWLNSANIPLLSEDRLSERFPVIGAGGAMTYINPLLLSAVCDFIVLGDALEALPFAVESLRRYLAEGDKTKLLDQLAEHPSILVPSLHIKNGSVNAKRVLANDQPLDAGHPMNSTWLTPRSSFGKTLLVELQRGCVRNCSYCTLPGCFGKMRYRDSGMIKERLEQIFSVNEVDRVGLVTPEAGDHPQIEDILDFLESRNKGVSFASLRIDRLTEKMLSALKRGGRHSVTVAPETGSDKLRFSCGKKFTNDMILEKLQMASSLGIDQAKLYFMTGLPGETDDDIRAIIELSGRVIAETGMNLILSVNPFIPKPGTVWSRMEFEGTAGIRKKYEILVQGLSKIKKKRPQLRMTSPKEAESEFFLAWYGYNESAELAKNKGVSKKVRFDPAVRAKTLLELERLWQFKSGGDCMVTRRTRNYKEKKPMATFGQFILPLTVIMAAALLFFSVKLFFFSPNGSDDIVFSKQEPVVQESVQSKPEVKVTNQDPAGSAAVKKVEIKQAQPVDVIKEELQKKAQAQTVSAKATAKPSAAAKEITQESQKVQPASVKAPRWDVQIGAFSSKENALQLIEKVSEKGYTAYLTEGIDQGTPFYKVRVKNPKTGKDEAEALSKKLEKDGYPFFLVEINQLLYKIKRYERSLF